MGQHPGCPLIWSVSEARVKLNSCMLPLSVVLYLLIFFFSQVSHSVHLQTPMTDSPSQYILHSVPSHHHSHQPPSSHHHLMTLPSYWSLCFYPRALPQPTDNCILVILRVTILWANHGTSLLNTYKKFPPDFLFQALRYLHTQTVAFTGAEVPLPGLLLCPQHSAQCLTHSRTQHVLVD